MVDRVMEQHAHEQEWISTGEAARLLGYKSRDGFRLKFLGIIKAMRLPSGHYRWSKAEIIKLRDDSVVII